MNSKNSGCLQAIRSNHGSEPHSTQRERYRAGTVRGNTPNYNHVGQIKGECTLIEEYISTM